MLILKAHLCTIFQVVPHPDLMQITQEQTDRDQLRMLSIFHFVMVGLSVLGLGFLFLHRLFMQSFFSNPGWAGNAGVGPPPEVMTIMEAMYRLVDCAIVVQGLLTGLSGYFLWHRKFRMFSIIVAAINCLNIPLGTVVGVFTLVVLMRESVQIAYGDQ